MRRIGAIVSLVGLVAGLLGACGNNHDLEANTPTTRHSRFPAAVVATTTPSTTPFGAAVRPTTTTARKSSTATTAPRATTTTTVVAGRVKPAETPLPVARAGVAGTAWQGVVVVAGGAGSGGGFSVRVDSYDPKSGVWTSGPHLPVALRDASMGVLGDDLWVLGGTAIENGQPVAQSKTYVFRSKGDGWEDGPSLHTARAGGAVATLGSFLVVVGGETTDGTILDSVEVLPKGGSAWKVTQPMTIPRAFASALAMNGRIYAVGGRNPGAPAVNSVESWRSGSSGWRQESHLDKERVEAAGAGSCVSGGENSSGVVTSVECFGTGFWVTQGQMRVPRFGLAAVVLDGWLHLIGGATAGTPVTNTHEVIDVSAVPT
jgi:serine/threonine-protein kinase PknK